MEVAADKKQHWINFYTKIQMSLKINQPFLKVVFIYLGNKWLLEALLFQAAFELIC